MDLLSFISRGREYVYFLYNGKIEYGYKDGEYIKQDLSEEEVSLMDRYVKFIPIDNLNYLDEFNIRHIRFHRATKGILVGIHPFLTRQMDRCRRIVYKLKQIIRVLLSKILRIIRRK